MNVCELNPKKVFEYFALLSSVPHGSGNMKPIATLCENFAKERGLEPLAELIYAQNESYEPSIEAQAEAYIDEEKGVGSVEEALQGAKDIIAEDISDDAAIRSNLRRLYQATAMVVLPTPGISSSRMWPCARMDARTHSST